MADRNKEDRVSWLYVQPLPAQLGSFAGSIKLKVPKADLREIHPVDLADILEELEGGQRVALFNALDAEQASDTLEEVEPRVQRELIHAIEKERAAMLINEMSPAQAADILAILPRDEADAILKLIDRDKSSRVEHIIGQHDEQILLYASPELIRLPATTPAAEVLDRYRELATGKNVVTYVYVTDAAGTLKGVVDLRGIVAAEPGQSLGDIMTEHVIALPKDATLREAVMLFERYNFRALPITDEYHHLLGAVSSRDMRGLRPRLALGLGSRCPAVQLPVIQCDRGDSRHSSRRRRACRRAPGDHSGLRPRSRRANAACESGTPISPTRVKRCRARRPHSASRSIRQTAPSRRSCSRLRTRRSTGRKRGSGPGLRRRGIAAGWHLIGTCTATQRQAASLTPR